MTIQLSFRKSGRDNLFKCTYVLPDGITHTKGFVKDINEAQRYRTLYDETPNVTTNEEKVKNPSEDAEDLDDRKKVDLTKNVHPILPYSVTSF